MYYSSSLSPAHFCTSSTLRVSLFHSVYVSLQLVLKVTLFCVSFFLSSSSQFVSLTLSLRTLHVGFVVGGVSDNHYQANNNENEDSRSRVQPAQSTSLPAAAAPLLRDRIDDATDQSFDDFQDLWKALELASNVASGSSGNTVTQSSSADQSHTSSVATAKSSKRIKSHNPTLAQVLGISPE